MEQFYTIQGEGYHFGKAAYFIRVGGCDIGCRWCDTKMSWNPDIHRAVEIQEIVTKAKDTGCDAVVVTGGEPSMYNLSPLCALLKQNNIETFVETSGAYTLTGEWDWICLSPKKQTPPKPDIFKKADELKVIIFEPDDFTWAEHTANQVAANCKLYLQPEWSKHKEMIPLIVEYVKKHTQWQVSLQAHKFMKIP